MKTCLTLCLAGILSLPFRANADTTLVYELVDAAGTKTQQTYTIRERFVRVDQNPATPKSFLLLDGGFLFMYVVDGEKGTFTTFGESPFHQGAQVPADAKAASAPEPAKKAAATPPPKPVLSPTGKKASIAGIRCREVNEMRNDKPVAEHCMADAAALGMTPRELITMARLIEFSKQKTDPDWIALQSDEQFIAIRSGPPGGAATFVLKSVSHDIVPWDYFRVPREYKKLPPADDYAGLITGKK